MIDKQVSIGTVAQLKDYYQANFRSDNPRTRYLYDSTLDRLIRFFGGDQAIATITQGDAEEFKKWNLEKGSNKGGRQSISTADNYINRTKVIFRKALNKGWIRSNPFASIKTKHCSNPENVEFVSKEIFEKVAQELGRPGTSEAIEQQLILALGRWGGLRLPSEPHDLEWSKIDFDNDRFDVYARKTKTYRTIPIFPELRPYFDRMILHATDKVFVCPWLRSKPHARFYQVTVQAIANAEVDQWPRVLQNLRASRSNEIERDFGPKLESAWIGHNSRVAESNYFSVSEADFELAASKRSILADIVGDPDRLRSEIDSLSEEDRDKLLFHLNQC